jgi:stage IV sporulation protein FA
MQEWIVNVKKRRERKIQEIKQGGNLDLPIPAIYESGENWESMYQINGKTKTNRINRWKQRLLLQSTIAAFLFTLTVFVPRYSGSAEQFVQHVMTEPLQFAAIQEWYQQTVSQMPAFLPTFQQDQAYSKQKWQTPARGKIVLPYNDKRKGIVLELTEKPEVAAAGEGWVTFVGTKEGLGQTVIIQHADGKETWYGFLAKTQVKEKDWVKRGQRLGEADERQKAHYLYFALKQNGKFIDPLGVVPVE